VWWLVNQNTTEQNAGNTGSTQDRKIQHAAVLPEPHKPTKYPSSMCPACKSNPHDTQHLFKCTKVLKTLSTIDIRNPRMSRFCSTNGKTTHRLHKTVPRASPLHRDHVSQKKRKTRATNVAHIVPRLLKGSEDFPLFGWHCNLFITCLLLGLYIL